MQLTQKETSYLKDAEKQEQLCVNAYQRSSQQVQDPQLFQLLQGIASHEQQHLQTIKQLQRGQVPTGGSQSSSMSNSSGQGGGSTNRSQNSSINQNQGQQAGMGGQNQGGRMGMSQGQSGQNMVGQSAQQSIDQQVCEELLAVEKSVSDLYDHAVFEFTDHQARQTLAQIQQDEQHHGFQLWQYMNQKGWYQAQ